MKSLLRLKEYFKLHPLPIIFLVMLVICGITVIFLDVRQVALKKEHARTVLLDVVADMERSLEYNLSVMHTLSLLIQNNKGTIDDFKPLAEDLLPMFPKVTALLLAPKGIVRDSYPYLGNEGLIGYNLLKEYDFWDRRVVYSTNRDETQVIGPLNLKRNWRGYIGLVPVYVSDIKDEENFWGFVAVLLRHEDLLPEILLSSLNDLGYAYQLLSVRTNLGDALLLDRSAEPLNSESVNQTIDLMGLNLVVKITPIKGWIDYGAIVKGVLAAVFSALILSWFITLGIRIRNNEKHMAKLAQVDILTNISNRRTILEKFSHLYEKAQGRNEVLAVGYLDVDKFKLINDELGHAAGDEILIATAKQIQKHLLKCDLVGRLGGDEFLFILVGRKSIDEAKDFARKLVEKLDVSIKYLEQDVKVSLSIGVAILPEDTSSPTMLVQHADMAMYEAKKVEGNSLSFYSKESFTTNPFMKSDVQEDACSFLS